MSNKGNPLVLHLRSDEVISNGDSQISKDFGGNSHPKLPNAATLSDGELSINMAKGYETIAIKNNNGEIVYIPFNVTGRILDAENEISDIERKINESRWYIIPVDGIPKKDLSQSVQESLDKADTAYQKPQSGIPESDLDDGFVQSKANIFDLGNMNVGDFLEKYSGEYLFKLWDYPTSSFPLINDNKIHTIVYANDNNQEYYYDFIAKELVAKYDHRDVPQWIKNGFAINKQDILVSGSNIKTINGKSILGDGNIAIDTDSYKIIDLGEQDDFIENESYYDGYYEISYSGTNLLNEINDIWESGKIPIMSFTLLVHGVSYSIPLYKKDGIFKAYGMYGGYGYCIDVTIDESVSHVGIHPIANTVNGKNGNVTLELEDIKPHDYSKDYLTITSLDDLNTISCHTENTENAVVFISVDDGNTWREITVNNEGAVLSTLNNGDKLLIKGNSLTGINLSSTKQFNVSGNIMSLLYGDDFVGQTDLTGYDHAFYGLFNECSGLVNAENLILPATTLSNNCYEEMFRDCTNLVSTPSLPSKTMADTCYGKMFLGCTSLTKAPELPSTILASNCYNSMFYGCTGLIEAPELPAMTCVEECYTYMFHGCTSLSKAPELPATTVADKCYRYMFAYCTNLTNAPSILPSTTLAIYCYQNMFTGCNLLEIAPELPSLTLVDYCYSQMFDGCGKLRYIKALFTTHPDFAYTDKWVRGVSQNGVFVKNDMAADVRGVDAMPDGWDIYTESEYKTVKKYELNEAIGNIKYPVTSVNGEAGDVNLDIPDAQVNSDWNATSGVTQILNAPTNVKNFNIDGHPGIKIDSDTIEIGNIDLNYFVVGSAFSTKNYIYFNEGGDNGLTLHADSEGLTLSSESRIDLNPKNGYKAYYNYKEIAVKDDIPTVPVKQVIQNKESYILPTQGGLIADSYGRTTSQCISFHEDGNASINTTNDVHINSENNGHLYFNSNEVAFKSDVQNASAYTTIDLGALDNFVVDGSWPNGYYEISTVTNLFNTIKTIWDNGKIPIIKVALSNHTASYIIPIYITNSMAMGHTMSRNGGYSIDVEIYNERQVIYTHSIGTYIKPSSGIPSSDLSSEVQESLNKADMAQSKLIYQEITSGSGMTLLVGYDYYMGTGDGEYGPVGTYDFTLDANPSDGEISVIFTTGPSPAITITSDSPIYVQEGYGIDANSTYEMNIKSIRGNYYVVVVKMRLI